MGHKLSNTKTYRIWTGVLTRCTNPRHHSYENYGARGITVCERWQKFSNFLADMGEVPSNGSIERKDNNGPYNPVNCAWATPIEQANNKRNNIVIEYEGRSQTAAQWAREIGIPRTTIIRRLTSGKTTEQILSKDNLPHAFLGEDPPIAAIRRAQTHCKQGHEFTPENTYVKPGSGTRACKICVLNAKRRFNAKLKAQRSAKH